jgi:O-antigen/teichoic acid export membrane protein
MRRLWREALPLLLNSILLTVFFRFDAIILRASSGDTVLGLYDAAYKVISLTQIIPPYVVGALFPLLAQRAVQQRDTLNPLVIRAIGVLQWVAWLGVINVVLLADQLIWILGGDAYLPDAAHILRILIWYLPLSYATGVVQYALIAVRRQQAITWAFAIGTVVNITGNVLLIPRIGAEAAAIMTIVTEVALLAGLWRTLRREHISLPLGLMARSGGASIIALGIGWLGMSQGIPAIAMAIVASMTLIVWGYQRQLFDHSIYGMVERIQQRFQHDQRQ